jgi:TorA maturation chaperone TorD
MNKNANTALLDQTSQAALLLARRACYRFVGLALADPRTDNWRELANPATQAVVRQAAEILRSEDLAAARPLGMGERPLADLDPATVFARLPTSADELNDLYESVFGLLGGSKCPPYETEYLPSKFAFQRSNALADIAGFYRAFGLQPSSARPERQDHVALECEFLAQLLELENRALQSHESPAELQAELCRAAQRKFLAEHAAWWLPAFAALLAKQDPGGFYEAAGHFLAALVAAERALLGVEPAHQRANPEPIESLDECSGCELASG